MKNKKHGLNHVFYFFQGQIYSSYLSYQKIQGCIIVMPWKKSSNPILLKREL